MAEHICALILGRKGSPLERVYERLASRGVAVAFRERPGAPPSGECPPILLVDSGLPEAREMVEHASPGQLIFAVGEPETVEELCRLGAIPLSCSDPELVEGALTGGLLNTLCTLEELKARLSLFEDLPWFGLYILDEELNIVYTSPYIQARLGRPLEGLRGRSVLEVVHPEFLPRVKQVLGEKLVGKEFPPYLIQLVQADGTPVWSEVFSRRVELSGRPHIVGVVRDVEAQRRQETLLRTLFRLVQWLLAEEEPKHVLQRVADAIVEVGGFRRAVISLYDLNWPDPLDAPVREVVTAGLSQEEVERLLASGGMGPEQRRAYFSDEFRVGPEAYYVPYHKNPFEIEGTGLPGTVEMEGWSPLDLLFVPLRAGDRIIGHISLDDPQDPSVPTPATLEPIAYLAAVAALAVERAHERKLRRVHERHLKASQAMGRRLFQAASPSQVLERAVQFLTEQLGYEVVGAGRMGRAGVEEFLLARRGRGAPREETPPEPDWPHLVEAFRERTARLYPRHDEGPPCPLAERLGISCSVIAPIFLNGEEAAFILVGEKEPYDLTELDLDTVSHVANWCEVTLETLRMRDRLSGLYVLSHSLSQARTRKELLSQVMKVLRENFTFDYCAFFRPVGREMELEALEVAEGIKLYPHIKPGWKLPPGEGVVSWVARERVPMLLPDVSSHPNYVPGNPDVRSELAVPVLAGDELLGVLNVESRQPAAFGGEELSILQAVAGQLSVALQNLDSQRKLRELAIRDPLTGLYNRRFLEEVIGQEVASARRYKRPLAFLYVDVDGFRAVNNLHGHLVGDEVLKKVAHYLQDNVRQADYVFRVGGDEFLILLPETDGEAREVVQRLKAGLGKAIEGLGVPIGLSIGVAVWEPQGEFHLESLIAEADRKMYEDKRRNSH